MDSIAILDKAFQVYWFQHFLADHNVAKLQKHCDSFVQIAVQLCSVKDKARGTNSTDIF